MTAWTISDALELLATRRSFKAVELAGSSSAAEIDMLLTVASRVPDHGSWHLGASSCLKDRRSAGEAIVAAFRAK